MSDNVDGPSWDEAMQKLRDENARLTDELREAREVLSAYDELVDDLRAENARLQETIMRAKEFVEAQLKTLRPLRHRDAEEECANISEASYDAN